MPLFRLRNVCTNFDNGDNSKAIQDIQIILSTSVARDNMHVKCKGHYSRLNYYWVMPLFRHRNLCKNFNNGDNTKAVQDIQMKLSTSFARDNMHVKCKGHNSRFDYNWVMPLFRLIILGISFNHGHNSKSVSDIHVTLGTHIARDNMYEWNHATFNIYWVMALFRLC